MIGSKTNFFLVLEKMKLDIDLEIFWRYLEKAYGEVLSRSI